MDSMGEGEGVKIWENGIETCKISCKKRAASPGSMHGTGCLGLVHWDDPEGWYGEGGGRRRKAVLKDTSLELTPKLLYLRNMIQSPSLSHSEPT